MLLAKFEKQDKNKQMLLLEARIKKLKIEDYNANRRINEAKSQQ